MGTTTLDHSAIQSPKTKMLGALLLVFLCGMVVGALGMNLGVHRSFHRSPEISKHVDTSMTLQKWKRELNLTDSQMSQIESILDDFSTYYDTVLADGKTRILKILDEPQRKKFEQMLKTQP